EVTPVPVELDIDEESLVEHGPTRKTPMPKEANTRKRGRPAGKKDKGVRKRRTRAEIDKDPVQTFLTEFVELEEGSVEGRPEHISYKYGERSSGLLLDQDASCLGGVQRGLQSRGFRGLWLSEPERRIRNFHGYYQRYLDGS
ncbi:MAG: SRPBCC family protein, partial [Pseudomonadales bacterium]